MRMGMDVEIYGARLIGNDVLFAQTPEWRTAPLRPISRRFDGIWMDFGCLASSQAITAAAAQL